MLDAALVVEEINAKREMENMYSKSDDYEKLFKVLAILTDGKGSLLWNEHPGDASMLMDFDAEDRAKLIKYCGEIVEKQTKWLDQIGFELIAKRWERMWESCLEELGVE